MAQINLALHLDWIFDYSLMRIVTQLLHILDANLSSQLWIPDPNIWLNLMDTHFQFVSQSHFDANFSFWTKLETYILDKILRKIQHNSTQTLDPIFIDLSVNSVRTFEYSFYAYLDPNSTFLTSVFSFPNKFNWKWNSCDFTLLSLNASLF